MVRQIFETEMKADSGDIAKEHEMGKIDKRFLGAGITHGMGLGVTTGNAALGLCSGIVFGLVVGRFKAKKRTLTGSNHLSASRPS
jgi:Na+/glutamate symporter